MVNLKILPSSNGDCFLLSIQEEKNNINILIDGGLNHTYNTYLKDLLIELSRKGEKLDIVINTHIDSDHIRGLIAFLKDNNENKFIKIGDIWFNGLEQIIQKYPAPNSVLDDRDEKILDDIIMKGYDDEFEQIEKISKKEGLSLSGLIEIGGYNHNKICNNKAITDTLEKLYISDNISIKIISPNKYALESLETKWFDELDSKNFYYTTSNRDKLAPSFEFIISRIKNYYESCKIKISSIGDIEDYLSDLDIEDSSVSNASSIAFVLEIYGKKYLFLGDAVIKNKENCKITENLINEYGDNLEFELVKLPHHGSNSNISKDFINLITAKDYIISTNSLKHGHPNLDVLANIIIKNSNKNFIFNYKTEKALFIDREVWKNKYQYSVIIGNGSCIIEREYS